jgi:hypothetical protein
MLVHQVKINNTTTTREPVSTEDYRQIVVIAADGKETIYKTDLDFAVAFGISLNGAVKFASRGLPFYRDGVKYTAKYID